MQPYRMSLSALKAYLPKMQKSQASENKIPRKSDKPTNAEKSHFKKGKKGGSKWNCSDKKSGRGGDYGQKG